LVTVIVDDLKGGVINGLQKQFGEDVQQHGEALTADAQKENCRIICHSNIQCTFWQSYWKDGLGTERPYGCWTENPSVDASGSTGDGGFVQYPTTVQDVGGVYDTERTDAAADVAAGVITGGQYIQHYCPVPTLPQRAVPTTTTTLAPPVVPATVQVVEPTPEPSGSFMNPWGYMMIVGGLLAALAAVVLMLLGNQKKPPAKTKRGIQPIKKKESPPPPAAPPQPVVPIMTHPVMVPTIPQHLTMTTNQQPTIMAQPAFAQQMTYAAAPGIRPY